MFAFISRSSIIKDSLHGHGDSCCDNLSSKGEGVYTCSIENYSSEEVY